MGHLPEQVVGLAGSQMLAAEPPAPHAPGGDSTFSDSFAGPEGTACTQMGRGASGEGRGVDAVPLKAGLALQCGRGPSAGSPRRHPFGARPSSRVPCWVRSPSPMAPGPSVNRVYNPPLSPHL